MKFLNVSTPFYHNTKYSDENEKLFRLNMWLISLVLVWPDKYNISSP